MSTVTTPAGVRHIALLCDGQSNSQGSAKDETGSKVQRHRSLITGETDPMRGSNNTGQGGSAWPYLIDMAYRRGVRLHIRNTAIGGASVFQYTGRVDGAVTGGADPTVPAAQGWMSPYGLSGTGAPSNPGDAGFDPFGFMARGAAFLADMPTGCTRLALWSNGEADLGASMTQWREALKIWARHRVAAGANAVLIGVTAKSGSATTGQMQGQQAAVLQAVAELRAEGIAAHVGADLFARFGDYAPTYPEPGTTIRVHLTGYGQQVHAEEWDKALAAAGY